MEKKFVKIEATNTEIHVSDYDVSFGKGQVKLEDTLIKALRDKTGEYSSYSNTFRGRISIVIEEVVDDLEVIGLPEEPKEEEEEDGEAEGI